MLRSDDVLPFAMSPLPIHLSIPTTAALHAFGSNKGPNDL